MKKLSFLDQVVFFINSIAAFLLLASYAIPYISPKAIATVSVLSLGMPILIILNIVFSIYWLIKIKKQVLLSLIILGIGYKYVNSFVQFSEKKTKYDNDIKIMSYNVRLFNDYKWSKKKDLDKKIYDFIKIKNPDIIAFQEYYPRKNNTINYRYSYILKSKGSPSHQAVFSKYKIVNKGSLDFDKSSNNAIYTDLKIKNDTLRIYNIHLQSFAIDTNKENFGEQDPEHLLKKFTSRFVLQERQVEQLLEHSKGCNYKTIFIGDFNNTAFSWAYRKLSNNKKDAFIEAGNGLGKSFNYIFPLRIDFILADEQIKINNFNTFNVDYSDHYPIMTRINLTE